ncbi:MAG TPA: PssD/Cps14F family polysaccharide biosynthesis glycosyltransferase [Thermodesulfobacteriota bacterium]|nr:PssD/Cps14F family polysaccharide biosynthesis glycosyltransferase [Thermodesulfobacteriota bacterium]
MKNIGILTSSGGHLTEAMSIIEAFEGHNLFLIVHDLPTLKNIQINEVRKIYQLRVVLGYTSLMAVFLTAVVNIFQLIRIFWIEKPSILFSTGAEIAIPAFYLGKILFRARLIYLETLTRVKDLSLTGKVLYPVVDLFLVQWPELLKKAGPKAVYGGRLI